MPKHYVVQVRITEVTHEIVKSGGDYRNPKTEEEKKSHHDIVSFSSTKETLWEAINLAEGMLHVVLPKEDFPNSVLSGNDLSQLDANGKLR